MTLEERVARAICFSRESCESGWYDCWHDCRAPYDLLRKSVRWTMALAAIAAMRGDRPAEAIQITEEMVEAGVDALHRSMGYQYDGDVDEAVRDVFRAMCALSKAAESSKEDRP